MEAIKRLTVWIGTSQNKALHELLTKKGWPQIENMEVRKNGVQVPKGAGIVCLEAGYGQKQHFPLIRQLHQQQTPFVVWAAQDDEAYWQQILPYAPAAYLVHPEVPSQLSRALELAALQVVLQQNAFPNLPTAKEDGIFFRVKNRLEKIRFNEVLWVQASDVYSIIRCEQARYLVSHTLKELEKKFPPHQFLRTHRSYLVNLMKIDAIEDNNLLIAKEYIPVGQTHKEALFQQLCTM